MGLILGLIAATGYGIGDFIGGLVSRRHSALQVLMLAYPISFVAALLVAPWAGGHLDLNGALLAAGAGLAAAVALGCFFAALSGGPMSVVSPLTALMSAGLPVLLGASLGETLSPLAWGGIVLALLAIVLVSQGGQKTPAQRLSPRVVGLALVSGATFALGYALLHSLPAGAGLWPVVVARAAGSAAILVAAHRHWGTLRSPPPGLLRWAALTGLLDATANTAVIYAFQGAQLSTISVVVSLYPVVTVILAMIILRERLRPSQYVGLGLAVAGLIAITLGAGSGHA